MKGSVLGMDQYIFLGQSLKYHEAIQCDVIKVGKEKWLWEENF